jgi:hypothetical protein
MTILARLTDERVLDVRFDEASLIVDLMDGRTIAAPLTWYPRLLRATPEQRAKLATGRCRLWHPLARHRRRPEHRGAAARRTGTKSGVSSTARPDCRPHPGPVPGSAAPRARAVVGPRWMPEQVRHDRR